MPKQQLTIKVDHPGLQTTVQDLGRPGYQAQGIPLSGALDRQAAMQANYLVGNSITEPVLEITLLGPKLTFEGAAQIAITGADLSASLDGKTIPLYQTLQVNAQSQLRFGKPQKGCRAYLAIGGKWQITPWLGSASMATQHPALLTPDSFLGKGKQLKIEVQDYIRPRQIPHTVHYDNQGITKIELLPGPDFDVISRRDLIHFFTQDYEITPDSNRMGYRLEPGIPGYNWPNENISSGIIPGTIQITNSGMPIILLADAQTVGGYPRIGNLTSEHLNTVAQLCPGDRLRFVLK